MLVVDKSDESKRVQGVLVIEGFPEVYANDLLGLPPNRELSLLWN